MAAPAGNDRLKGRPGNPAVTYEGLMAATEALGHFDNFDRHRGDADFLFGDADGHEFWCVTRGRDIREVLQRPDLFSSKAIIPSQPDPDYNWVPQMYDPPLHTKWRRLLSSVFSPGTVNKLKPKMRQRFSEILDDVAPKGHCDFVKDIALRFPNTIWIEMLGLPVEEAAMFQAWEEDLLHSNFDKERMDSAMREVVGYFTELIAVRRKNPEDDLVSKALSWQIDDVPLADDEILDVFTLLFMAGQDTVAAQITYAMLHLGTHDEDRRRLVAEPQLWPSAIEEFLRYYAFVTPGRKITTDIDFNGCPMKAGQMLFLPLSSAGRDPDEFPEADQVLIDRQDNRHIAFGTGPHRCPGLHLARAELSIGLPEWHRRIPEYRIVEGVTLAEHGGEIGLDNLPIEWDPA